MPTPTLSHARRCLGFAAYTIAALATAAAAAPSPRQDGLTLKALSVSDPDVGSEAFRMLIPAGWTTEGGVVWRHDRSNLATTAMRIASPEGVAALEFLPIDPFVWAEGGIAFFPPGTIYLGNEVHPVIADPSAFVERLVLPRYRSHAQGAQVVSRTNLPDVAREVAATVQEAGVHKTVHAARTRIEYRSGGRTIEEDIYAVLVYATSTMLPGTTFWSADRLYAFRAEKGTLDAKAPLLQSMLASIRINPTWFSKYRQVVHLWQQNQMQAIRNAGERSRYIARTNEEISAMQRRPGRPAVRLPRRLGVVQRRIPLFQRCGLRSQRRFDHRVAAHAALGVNPR
jgi:hypothetical protein